MFQKFNKINSLLILAAFINGIFMFPYIGNAGHDDLGHYDCFDKNRRTHVNCLRSLLDEKTRLIEQLTAAPAPPVASPTQTPAAAPQTPAAAPQNPAAAPSQIPPEWASSTQTRWVCAYDPRIRNEVFLRGIKMCADNANCKCMRCQSVTAAEYEWMLTAQEWMLKALADHC